MLYIQIYNHLLKRNNFFRQIEISGFDNKQHAIIEKIVDRIVNFKIDVETFEAVKQQVGCYDES